MQLPRRRGTQRRRAHRRNWRECTSLCTMRGGAMWWNFRTAWSERKRGREWRCVRGSHRSHGRTGKLATLSKRMTLCSNSVQHLPCCWCSPQRRGWPYSWHTIQDLPKDVFVNCEVDRVWQIVKGDLTAWFSPHGMTDFTPDPCVLIGTPGIGKSVAAVSYLLYQLLHCDAEELPMVVHCFGGGDAYVSDKTTRAVTRCSDEDMCISELRSLRGHGRNAYIIYDVAKEGTPPPRHFARTSGWGMIAVPFPRVTNYDEWAKQLQTARIIVNCPDEVDVKTMCAWITRDETKEKQAECWKEVKKHMYLLGPIPRHVFDEEAFKERCGAVEFALQTINEESCAVFLMAIWM
ncbi:retrotransposon hot spot (RHS) protein [Trypanosoma cruzi Dm28c]|uniref:Retrotransposon hot spot (RHS) protein n=2 Tax=Trypanosoma cruzi TaxID=5693 RepID=V5A2V4_TRYCR|nr:retrotransposon hot spot (RHS) protein [Trypanosoma cruzi Dm28c]PWU86588.1 putative retrotransposon hot spot (RHS) protein [Trypanosoma cruzi]